MINWELVYLVGYVLTSIIIFGEVFLYSPKYTTDRIPAYIAGFIIFFFAVFWPLFWVIFIIMLVILYIKNYNDWKKFEKDFNDNPILRTALQNEIKKNTEQYLDSDISD